MAPGSGTLPAIGLEPGEDETDTVSDTGTGSAGPASRRPRLLAGVIAAALAVISAGGLAASGALGTAPASRQGAPGPSASASGTSPAVRYVLVPSFRGSRYAAVSGWLRAHDLAPLIAWDDNTALATGTVVSVQPSGPVPAGSTVIVTIAWNSQAPPPGGIASLPRRPPAGQATAPVGAVTGRGPGASTSPGSAATASAVPGGTPAPAPTASGGAAPTTGGSAGAGGSSSPVSGSPPRPTPSASCTGIPFGPYCL
jgi:hypothetical protein